MSDWEWKPLGHIAELTMGQSPPGSEVLDLKDDLPFLQGNGEFGAKCPVPKHECANPPRSVEAGQSLISVRAPVAAINMADQPYGIGRGLAGVQFHGVNPRFGHHALPLLVTKLQRLAQGTTFDAIGKAELACQFLPVPLVTEQRRIAEILDTIDETIQATERIIDKLRTIQLGCIRGAFQQLAGRPMTTVAGLGLDVTVGIVVRPTQYYKPRGIPILRSANVRANALDLTDLAYMSERDHTQLAKTAVVPGELVTVRTGYPGTTAVVPSTLTQANCVDILITRPAGLINPEFLALWVNSEFGKGFVLSRQGGLAQQHFNVADMRSLPIPNIDADEQGKLVVTAESLAASVSREDENLGKLKAIRAGLAADLLTGKVRTVAK